MGMAPASTFSLTINFSRPKKGRCAEANWYYFSLFPIWLTCVKLACRWDKRSKLLLEARGKRKKQIKTLRFSHIFACQQMDWETTGKLLPFRRKGGAPFGISIYEAHQSNVSCHYSCIHESFSHHLLTRLLSSFPFLFFLSLIPSHIVSSLRMEKQITNSKTCFGNELWLARKYPRKSRSNNEVLVIPRSFACGR